MTSKPYLSLSKSVCQNCGTINAVDGTDCYSFGKNVYSLNPCDHNFFLDFDNTTYTPYDGHYHTTVLKAGEYCQFCKGTYARATEKQEVHSFDETIDGELGNQRFHITGECEDCGYIKNEYIAAKSVIQSYYGKADGQAHTVTISDLSESGVNTSIRYGTSASKCNLTSAPNYTDEGYYPVYYEITYSYSGESMTENGVSYVWLLADNSSDVTVSGTETPHVHDYRFLETVRPTCTELGYDRFQCSGCGALQKTNYVPATGHDYDTIVIREASCQQGGLELHMCKNCGSYYTESTSMIDHTYTTNIVPATCTMNGYTEHICIDCGYKYITDLTPLAKHDYREKVTSPTCKARGFTTYTCADCGDIYISDYTEPLGHDWDEGHTVTSSTCEGEGVIEYDCKRCDETMIAAISATGHTPGEAATCTEPQICIVCGAILELPTGHSYTAEITEPTCTTFGYTTYTCEYGDHNDTRYLWPEMVRVISELHPHWVLGENVSGFINVGLDKTIFDLEREGYTVQTFVYPACGIGAWHERTRTFIVAADVSYSPCVRQAHCKGRNEPECISVGQRDIQKEKSERSNMEPAAVSGGVLLNSDSVGRNKVEVSAGGNEKKQGQGEPCGADNFTGKSAGGNGGAQSRLDGMVNGFPFEMDGHKLWKREPAGVPRITEKTENRAARLKTLGNAVCPPQVFPILKCIADIETGACKENCAFGKFC